MIFLEKQFTNHLEKLDQKRNQNNILNKLFEQLPHNNYLSLDIDEYIIIAVYYSSVS